MTGRKGTLRSQERRRGEFVNQSMPDFEDGSPEPSVSEVRILLTQPTTHDSDDLSLFISRRADLRRVLSRLHGGIGVARV